MTLTIKKSTKNDNRQWQTFIFKEGEGGGGVDEWINVENGHWMDESEWEWVTAKWHNVKPYELFLFLPLFFKWIFYPKMTFFLYFFLFYFLFHLFQISLSFDFVSGPFFLRPVWCELSPLFIILFGWLSVKILWDMLNEHKSMR